MRDLLKVFNWSDLSFLGAKSNISNNVFKLQKNESLGKKNRKTLKKGSTDYFSRNNVNYKKHNLNRTRVKKFIKKCFRATVFMTIQSSRNCAVYRSLAKIQRKDLLSNFHI